MFTKQSNTLGTWVSEMCERRIKEEAVSERFLKAKTIKMFCTEKA